MPNEPVPDEVARLRRVIESQQAALAEWRRGFDHQVGELERYRRALHNIATTQWGNVESARRRALKEL